MYSCVEFYFCDVTSNSDVVVGEELVARIEVGAATVEAASVSVSAASLVTATLTIFSNK